MSLHRVKSEGMIFKWYSNNNRTIAITVLLCIFLLYFSYTFNTCLISKLGFRRRSTNVTTEAPKDNTDVDSTEIRILGSIVRIVSLVDDPDNKTDHGSSQKYRLFKQQGLQRHLPDALIIGVKKSGTRALLEFIRLHPDVRAAGMEVHFFDRHYAKGLNWYRNKMPATISNLQITMEKTPSYFITKEAPKRVYNMNPKTKLLVVVRDPITRAVSDYTQAVSKKKDMKKFEELAFVNGSWSGGVDRGGGAIVDTNWGPIKIGVYAKYLERWLNYFPLSSFLVVSGERLISDPAAEIYRVQDFLGLKRVITEKHFYFNSSKGFPCLLKSEARSTPHCLGKTKGRNHPNIDPDCIERLRNFYRPFNEKFYQLSGINFGWP